MRGLVSVSTGQVGCPANRPSRTEAHRVHTRHGSRCGCWVRIHAPQPSSAARIPLGTYSVFGRTRTLESLQRPGQ